MFLLLINITVTSNLGEISQNGNKLGRNLGPMQTVFGIFVQNICSRVTEVTYSKL